MTANTHNSWACDWREGAPELPIENIGVEWAGAAEAERRVARGPRWVVPALTRR